MLFDPSTLGFKMDTYNNNNTGLLYRTFLLLDNNQSALHSMTPAKIASIGNLTYCCHARRRSQYPLQLGTHIFPWVKRGTVQVDILPKDVIPHETVGISGDRTTILGLWVKHPTNWATWDPPKTIDCCKPIHATLTILLRYYFKTDKYILWIESFVAI